jgi:hypothetical protein
MKKLLNNPTLLNNYYNNQQQAIPTISQSNNQTNTYNKPPLGNMLHYMKPIHDHTSPIGKDITNLCHLNATIRDIEDATNIQGQVGWLTACAKFNSHQQTQRN